MTEISLDEIEDNFSYFDDWEERFSYLIELGNKLPDLAEEYKNRQFFVPGCQAQVWLVPGNRNGRLYFQADSDGRIQRGLIYILLAAFNDKTAREIVDFDIEAAFTRLGLQQNLTPNRRNGFFAMVGKIKSYAQAYLSA